MRQRDSFSGVIHRTDDAQRVIGQNATCYQKSCVLANFNHCDIRIDTGTQLRSGKVEGRGFSIISRMNDGAFIFADGMEQDFVSFDWGRKITIGPANKALCMVVP